MNLDFLHGEPNGIEEVDIEEAKDIEETQHECNSSEDKDKKNIKPQDIFNIYTITGRIPTW